MSKENKFWTGNKNSVFKQLGASNHTKKSREKYDYYATDPIAVKYLLELETFNKNILEPACGEGHLCKEIQKHGYNTTCSDLIDRNYGEVKDFFFYQEWNGDIITNPPYRYAQDFVEHALRIIPVGNKVAMFLRIQFLEGKRRKILFKNYPPKIVYISSSRIICAKNAKFDEMKKSGGSASAYIWIVWEKGYKGDTIIKWFN